MKEAHIYGINPKKAACGYEPKGDLAPYKEGNPKCIQCMVWLKALCWQTDEGKK